MQAASMRGACPPRHARTELGYQRKHRIGENVNGAYVGVVVVILAVGVLLLLSKKAPGKPVRKQGRQAKYEQFKASFLTRLGAPTPEAARIFERLFEDVQTRHPGKSLDWYMERMEGDLNRDRR